MPYPILIEQTRAHLPTHKPLIRVRARHEPAPVDALDLVLSRPGDEMPVVDCSIAPSPSAHQIEWKTARARTDPLLARLQRARGDRAEALHPHHARATDVSHEQAFTGDYIARPSRIPISIPHATDRNESTHKAPSRSPGSSWCA